MPGEGPRPPGGGGVDIHDYERRYAEQYRGAGWFEQVYVRARRNRVFSTLAAHPSARVLEVGCGMEPLFVFDDAGRAWTVVEPSPVFCQRAREAAQGRDVTVIEGFLEELVAEGRGPGGRFDVIVVSSLLHEVVDPARLLATLRGLADAGTVLHLNVPNMRSLHRLLAVEAGLIGSVFEPSELEQRFQRNTRYDKERFLDALRDAGFAVLRSGSYFVKPFTSEQMEQIFDAGIVPRAVLDALETVTRELPELGAEIYADVRLDPGG